MSTVSPPTVLLFDLGGVLLESTAFERLNDLLPHPVDSDDLKARWLASPAARAFERGRIAPATFAQHLVAEWGLACTPTALLAEYASWVRGFEPGTLELLASLRGRYRLACLSNSNEVHWNRFDGFRGVFDIALASHLLGEVKPDAACFTRALEALGVEPAAVAFFDDARPNVEAARALGIRAHRTLGLAGVRAVLATEGWLA